MELEGLLNGNQILIFFIGVFYILINEEIDKRQKIIMIYIFTYTLKLFNVMELRSMLVVLGIVTFIYIGFLSKDILKNNILCNIWDKIKDYTYKCIFEYSSIYFILSIMLISDYIQNHIQFIQNFNIVINMLGVKINIISLVLLGYVLNNITSQKYETNSFQYIKKRMDSVAIWTNITDTDFEKFNMLIDIEDKSYFIRQKSYNFISLEFIKYIFNKKLFEQINFKIDVSELKEILMKEIHLKDTLNGIKKYIRGYSTIEMQIIRTLGIKYGYNSHILCRKVYELLYSRMFFKSLRKYMNKSYLDTGDCCFFKEYLLIIYIGIAPIKLNGNRYSNMLEVWDTVESKEKEVFKRILEVSKEQFFISILGLSNRIISNEIIDNYYVIVEKYNLDISKLKQLIKKFYN